MMKRPHLLAFLLGTLLVMGLCWPLPLGLGTHWTPSAYATTHAWAAGHLFDSLLAGSNPHEIYTLGYPWIREARFIGWAPAIASWPLRPLLGTLGAFQLITLLSLPFSAWIAGRLIQQSSGWSPWMAAPAGLIFGFCPYQLATLQTGEVPKLQLWVIPLFLLALLAVKGLKSKSTLLLAGSALIASFTSPYYGLALPLLAGGAALVYGRAKKFKQALAVLGGSALGMLPALFYYGSHPRGGASFYRPAMAPLSLDGLLPVPHPVASVRDLVLGVPAHSSSPWDAVHESYVGLVLLTACAVFFWRSRHTQRPGRSLGLGLAAFGVLLAMGPRLAFADHSTSIPLPASLLDLVNYPLGAGGMYYRMVPFAMLGLALTLAASLPQTRRGFGIMWLVVGLQFGDAVRSTGPWPLPVEAVPSSDFFRSIRGQDGAVLLVPIVTARSPGGAQKAVLRQIVHHRPEIPLPTDINSTELRQLQRLLERALQAPDPAEALRSEGFRYVLYRPEMATAAHHAERERLVQKLGPPQRHPRFLIWDLGATTLKPRPFAIRNE
jgi:hypothetical protein